MAAKKKSDTMYDRFKKAKTTMFTDTHSVYVHSKKSSYTPILSAENAEARAKVEYQRSARQFKKIAAKDLRVSGDQAIIILQEMAELMGSSLKEELGSRTKNPSALVPISTSSVIVKDQQSIELNTKSFQSIANSVTYSRKNPQSAVNLARPIIDNVNLSQEYLDKIASLIELYGNLSAGSIAEVVANAKSGGGTLTPEVIKGIKVSGSGVDIIHGKEGAQKTSINKLIDGYVELNKLLGKPGTLSSSSIARAEDIMCGVAGWFKAIGGQGMEVIADAAYQSAAFAASKEFKSIQDKFGGEIQIKPSDNSSSDKVAYDPNLKHYSLLNSQTTTRKSDVTIVMDIRTETGSFELAFGGSLKQKELQETRSSTFDVHSGSLKNFLIRTKSFENIIEYDLVNSMVYNTSNYTAMKKLIAARGALSALTGFGAVQDTAYVLVFSNKAITMYDYLNSISEKTGKDTVGPLSIKLEGEGDIKGISRRTGYRKKDFKKNADDILNSYARSRAVTNLIYEKVKINISGTTPKLSKSSE